MILRSHGRKGHTSGEELVVRSEGPHIVSTMVQLITFLQEFSALITFSLESHMG